MSLIKRLFSSKAPRRLEHLVFGEAIYIEAELGSYWEAEVAFEGGRLFVAIESQDQQEPTIHQVAFYRRIVTTPDEAFTRVQSMLVPAFEVWSKMKFPQDWREAFALSGLSVPLDGNDQLPWELSFEAKVLNNQLFSCKFKSGKLAIVEISG